MIETEATRKKFLKEREVAAAALRRALKMRIVTKVPGVATPPATPMAPSATPIRTLPGVATPSRDRRKSRHRPGYWQEYRSKKRKI